MAQRGHCEFLIRGEIDQADVLDLLTRLVDKSLVVADERGSTVRYRPHSTRSTNQTNSMQGRQPLPEGRSERASRAATSRFGSGSQSTQSGNSTAVTHITLWGREARV